MDARTWGETIMESWRVVWRRGIVPQLSRAELAPLREVLATDDPRLIQGATTSPPDLACMQNEECTEACLLGCVELLTHDVRTVAQVVDRFASLCIETDCILGEPAACRWLINWFDDVPRDVVFRELLSEVELALSERAAHAAV